MENSKEIRRRIKSVKNIGQITKAMELVSAAKMRKAQTQALSSRPYATLSSALLENLVPKVDKSLHPLLQKVLPEGEVPSDRVLIILISSDRGLAGALNANVINEALKVMRDEGASKIDFITIGRKANDAIRSFGLKQIANFPLKGKDINIFDAKPITEMAVEEFMANHYEKVFVVYTHFISTLNQTASITQILPISKEGIADKEDFVFEPSPDEVIENLIHHTIEFKVYQTLVEAAASEHSARMVAMRNANEAATDLMDDLQLTYNQARQAGITRELSEISAAKLAMEE
jgi:F-type H+-transporting ATPase subunit gamma